MKAPHGTGMVVATADIQNWKRETEFYRLNHLWNSYKAPRLDIQMKSWNTIINYEKRKQSHIWLSDPPRALILSQSEFGIRRRGRRHCCDLCQALNDTKGNRQELLVTVSLKASPVWFQCIKAFHVAYLHNSEEDERDEDVDLGVFPGMVVADVVKLLRHTLTAPCPIVKQRH